MSNICNAEVRGGGNCLLDEGHKGYHSTVVFMCESCSRRVRGIPHRQHLVRLGDGTVDDVFNFCFPCVKQYE